MSKVFELIREEKHRQTHNVELIASENYISEDVTLALASCFTNKYAEGYPGHRYYGGCQVVDELERYCQKKWQDVFNNHYYKVNVQPHSGTQANMAAFSAVLKPDDTILSMSLDNGGHLSHGAPASFSGKLYDVVQYNVNENGWIDYNDILAKIRIYRPNLVLAGASAYPRKIDFKRIYEIIQATRDGAEHCPYFMVDMSHIAGLVATGEHHSPFGYADIITTTTHKTLRGPRGGLIFSRPELAHQINSAVFPNIQGGPHMNVIAAKAVCAEEACTKEFKQYIHDVVENTRAMADEFKKMGYKLATDGTDNHLFLIDFSETHPHITGKMVQECLDEHGISVNKNMVPGDKRKPNETSGIRIGCAAMTTRGWDKDRFITCAQSIDTLINKLEEDHKV